MTPINQFNFIVLLFIFTQRGILCQNAICPDPAELLPACTCYLYIGQVRLVCNNATSEDELEQIFNNLSEPTMAAYELSIHDNTKLKSLTKNVFGGVSFEFLSFINSAIEIIDDSVFENSYTTLIRWEMSYCSLVCPGCQPFPFGSLNLYTELKYLYLYYAGTFDNLPNLLSNSLVSLDLYKCGISNVLPEMFAGLPNLTSLDLYGNHLMSVPLGIYNARSMLITAILGGNDLVTLGAGTFQDLPALLYIDIQKNSLTSLSPGFMVNCPNVSSVNIVDNQMASFDVGTFDDMQFGMVVLTNNSFTTLDQTWLSPILENSNYVFLGDNPLECGCDMAWLFQTPTLMETLYGSCENGTNIVDLDSSYYINFC